MTTGKSPANPPTAQGFIALFGLFAGVCTVFALVFSAADALREHAQQSWPQTTATIERCGLDPYHPFSHAGRDTIWHIECRINYLVHGDIVEAKIRSRSAKSGADTELMNRWVAEHRRGSPIIIHYNPADHNAVVLTATDMPYAGPRTPDNLRLTLIAAATCAIMLTIAKVLRAQASEPSAPA